MRTTTSTKGRTFSVTIPTTEQLGQLLQVCSRRAPSGLRDRALLAVMAYAGLRVAEATQLRTADVNLNTGFVTVRSGKGGKARRVSLAPVAVAMVDAWLQRRTKLGIRGSWMFCTISENSSGEPVDPACVRQMMRRRARRAGLEGRWHPHALRHWHATSMAAAGVPLHVVSKQLGHTNVSTTSTYLNHVQNHELTRAVDALPTVAVC